MGPRVLAIESSCDETACAVVDGLFVESSVVASQIEVHARFGGVVPELASRHHLDSLAPVIRSAIERAGLDPTRLATQLGALAVTDSPGLVGALLVGVQAARGLALATGLPLHGIHHMEGHLFSAFIGDAQREPTPFVPHLALLVSGGHTELVDVRGLGAYEILGATRDDAAGEAFDKVGKLLGLPYPGGPAIDRLAAEGRIHVVGGVAANAGLRAAFARAAEREGFVCVSAPLRYCGDNAAMIAAAAAARIAAGHPPGLEVRASVPIDETRA
jgi:N6-L-threonylcarbamoyladenine synthase